MDDGQLSKKICEESNESDDKNAEVVYECCACDEAKFEVCIKKFIYYFINLIGIFYVEKFLRFYLY